MLQNLLGIEGHLNFLEMPLLSGGRGTSDRFHRLAGSHHQQFPDDRYRYLLRSFRADVQSDRYFDSGNIFFRVAHLPEPFRESGRPSQTAQDPDVPDIGTKQNFKNRQVVFGRMAEQQSETELIDNAIARDLPGKANKNFAGGGKPFLIREPRSRIDDVNTKSRLARKRRHRHRHLTGAKDEEVGIMANDLDEKLHLRLLSLARRLKITVQSHCAREALRQ